MNVTSTSSMCLKLREKGFASCTKVHKFETPFPWVLCRLLRAYQSAPKVFCCRRDIQGNMKMQWCVYVALVYHMERFKPTNPIGCDVLALVTGPHQYCENLQSSKRITGNVQRTRNPQWYPSNAKQQCTSKMYFPWNDGIAYLFNFGDLASPRTACYMDMQLAGWGASIVTKNAQSRPASTTNKHNSYIDSTIIGGLVADTPTDKALLFALKEVHFMGAQQRSCGHPSNDTSAYDKISCLSNEGPTRDISGTETSGLIGRSKLASVLNRPANSMHPI